MSYRLFTPPTLTIQYCLVLHCLVLPCPCRRYEHNCRQDKTILSCLDPVSMSFVSSRPIFQFATVQYQIYWWLLKTWKLETGSRRDKLVETGSRQDKTALSCPCRRCEQATVLALIGIVVHHVRLVETLSGNGVSLGNRTSKSSLMAYGSKFHVSNLIGNWTDYLLGCVCLFCCLSACVSV